MEKIIRTSKFVNKFLKILFWVIAIVMGITALLSGLSVIGSFGSDVITDGGVTLSVGVHELTLAEEYSARQARGILLITLANVIIFGVTGCYIIKVLQGVFKPMSEGQPFVGSVSSALKKLAFAVLISGIAQSVMEVITNIVYFNTFDIPSLFDKTKVLACDIDITVDGTFLIWFALILLLGHIFRYGEQLQRESDETL